MTEATVSNWRIEVGTAASPQVLTRIEEAKNISGIGVSNNILDATNFDSPAGTMEYLAGLSDGSEFTVECNYSSNQVHQAAVMAAVDAKATRLARLSYTGSSPNKRWGMSVVCVGYEIAPSVTDINSITFTFKITGGVARV